jgi:hypothetical protein
MELRIEKEPENPNKLQLNLNGVEVLEWFRQGFKQNMQEKVMTNERTSGKCPLKLQTPYFTFLGVKSGVNFATC